MLKIKRLIEERREQNRRRGRAGAEARKRKIAEGPAPEYPRDRTGDYRIVHIEDCQAGKITEHILMLEPTIRGRCDQFEVWLDAENKGVMGWDKVISLAGKQFLRQGAIRQ